MTDYAALLPFCETDTQRRVAEALVAEGSLRKAAKALGQHHTRLSTTIARIRRNAAQRGHAPEHGLNYVAPDPFTVNKLTLQCDADGTVERSWPRLSIPVERQKLLMAEALEALREDIPRAKPAPLAKGYDADLLNCLVVTDYHLGMRAWPEETRGDAWDTDIAEDLLVRWFDAAIATCPKAHTAVLAQLGDFLHFDSLSAITPTSGHLLDADTRYQRVVRVAIRVLRRVIAALLDHHERVHIIMAEGNHDIASSAWLREFLDAFYADEPRVTVDVSPDPYYCVEWGDVSLYFHHGHLRGQAKGLDKVFASKFRETYGRTKHAYGHTGHLHHIKELESELMPIRQHRTLAPNDSHGSRYGYQSGRDAQVITYHKRLGQWLTVTISPEMVLGT